MKNNLFTYTLRIADDSLILGQRLSELCGHGPILEEDIALTNIALDLIGQANSLYEYAATTEHDLFPKLKSADDLAFLRYEREYKNLLLVEQPNGDFAQTLVRSFLFDAFRVEYYTALMQSKDQQLAAIAEKSLKETKYHFRHSAEWVIRLGDGTAESHERTQAALDHLWKYTSELFFEDEIDETLKAEGIAVSLSGLKDNWNKHVQSVIEQATLSIPSTDFVQLGGRTGRHTEHLGFLLAEMQYMQRAYPGMEW